MKDKISALPDSLICHILSFLPTKQAVATSVISKRWRPLWPAISTLNFDDKSYPGSKDAYLHFLRLVYTVMLLRGRERPIKKFILNCESTLCDSSDVITWVMAATQSKVEHLSLFFRCTKISLPYSFISSTTLVVLKLTGFNIHNNNHSSVCFPSLKVLDLSFIYFHHSRYIVEFLSACPVLEVLVMKFLRLRNLNIAHISDSIHLPKLVKADIYDSSFAFPLQSFYNVEFLSADVIKKKHDLSSACNFSNLTYMELGLVHYYCRDWVIELLRYCPNLQNFVIDKKCVIGITTPVDEQDEKWVHPQFVPECFISKLKSFRVSEYGGKECELQFVRFIMQNARVLLKATIRSGSFSSPPKELQMLKDLSSCPRGSITCELYFE